MADVARAPIDAGRVRACLAEVREEVGPGVTVLAAVKYVAPQDMGALVAAGVTCVGENRAQALAAKQAAHPELDWHFIGHLQSRKVREVLPRVSLVHSVATESVLEQLARHGDAGTRVLVQVNVAGEEGKDGVAPADLDRFLERAAAGPATVAGLMTMPPAAEDPEASRRWFAALRELAHARGLTELSMGTTQDYAVAAQEGATIVRIGSRLYR